ncbi:Holliday junction resolvase RecU [Paenibacillus oleatilyticus]|uniref:Holliday junction resolvase RecU n=1 Tax=Paenibacillus oleatilyticus TaxID=2594886 RepID=UPI001C1FD3D9|nr:Holliday junction resolvase RecU [Paenibacillus oleatilyticus]MBU7320303.1 Holliday junction resolvase RecU [Paenibacillus oleatilyticus]
MTHANRGMDFEALIERSNSAYETEGLAIVNKRPTPVRVVKNVKGKLSGFYEKPSTVDFDGTLSGGRSVVFEAKQVKKAPRFDLDNISDHQVEYLAKCHLLGGIAFVLIELVQVNTIYLLPYPTFKTFWDRREDGVRGCKSISLEALDVHAEVVKSGLVPVDWLPVVNKIWCI